MIMNGKYFGQEQQIFPVFLLKTCSFFSSFKTHPSEKWPDNNPWKYFVLVRAVGLADKEIILKFPREKISLFS